MSKTKIIAIGILIIIVGYFIYNYLNKPAYTLPAGDRPFKGRADATVIVDEYSDFQCPACKAALPFVRMLDEKYGANIRFNYHHFPLRQIHQYAFDAALAAECAVDQGKFWEMHDSIFNYQEKGLTGANLKNAAKDAGLDLAQYDSCMANRARISVVKADEAEAGKIGLNGTPSFIVNGRYIADRLQVETEVRKLLGLPEGTTK